MWKTVLNWMGKWSTWKDSLCSVQKTHSWRHKTNVEEQKEIFLPSLSLRCCLEDQLQDKYQKKKDDVTFLWFMSLYRIKCGFTKQWYLSSRMFYKRREEKENKKQQPLPPLENYNLFVSLLVQKSKNHLHSCTTMYFLNVWGICFSVFTEKGEKNL